IWGGGMAMPEVVIQQEVTPLLDELGLTHAEYADGLHVISAIELAAGLVMKAVQAGATMLNLTTAEDVSVRAGRVTGLVANRTNIGGALPVDPIMFESRAVIDGTGHEAFVVECLRRRGLLPALTATEGFGEGPMDAAAGEEFVTKNASEIYPGLWVSGMSVCAAIGGPRMGPIFGGMLQSGRHAAQQILTALGKG
ncbi:MAG: thiazole biosynthesis protein, partial [Phycisphaerae bacterium]|nr:thiazole biosynthesis protein [Phycisphaerae bacterium]